MQRTLYAFMRHQRQIGLAQLKNSALSLRLVGLSGCGLSCADRSKATQRLRNRGGGEPQRICELCGD